MGSPEIAPSFARSTSLGYQVNHLARMLFRALGEEIEPHGVVPGQFAQLLALYERDGVTISELAEAVAIEQPTMSRTVRRMERDGLVTTRPHPQDRRSQQVFLTVRARRLEPELKAAAAGINEDFLSPLTPRQRSEVLSALTTIIDAATYRTRTDEQL